MKRIYLLYCLFLFSFYGFSETTFTLKQCVDYALKNHRSIKVAANDVAVAYARKREGQAAYMPQVNGQVKWDDNLQLQKTVIPAISLGTFTTPAQEVQLGQRYNTLVGVQVDQFLYNKSYLDGIKAVKPSYELAELKKAKTEEDVIYNTVVAYYQILLINEQEQLLQTNKNRLQKLVPIISLQYEKGVARKIDLDRIQVNLNNVVAQQEILNTKKELAYNNLKYSMAMPLDSVITIDLGFNKEIVALETFSDTSNIKNKIELKLLRKNLQLQNVLLKRTTAGYFPVLSVSAKYVGQAFGNTFTASLKNWSPIAAVGMRLDIPIFDGLRTASAIRQSKLNIASLKEDIASTEDGLKLQLKNADTKYANAVKSIDINKSNLDLAKSNLDVVTLQFEKGAVGYSELLSSETGYKEAEVNYISSFIDLLNSRLEIDKANGNLNNYK